MPAGAKIILMREIPKPREEKRSAASRRNDSNNKFASESVPPVFKSFGNPEKQLSKYVRTNFRCILPHKKNLHGVRGDIGVKACGM